MNALPRFLATAALGAVFSAGAAQFDATIAMRDKGAATFYVPGHIEGIGGVELMVDTGSGYTTINEETLQMLKSKKRARYIKKLKGIMADGSALLVPVYAIDRLEIGAGCELRDVEAAVFPGKTRFILGLSALAKASPFIFSVDPPELVLSNCTTASAE